LIGFGSGHQLQVEPSKVIVVKAFP